VAQSRRRPGLVQQARPALGAQPTLSQDFDRHWPVEQQVMGTVDHAHATPAQFGLQAVTILDHVADFHAFNYTTNRVNFG
jgi:hypothetical protein